jgi:hypothetical protein
LYAVEPKPDHEDKEKWGNDQNKSDNKGQWNKMDRNEKGGVMEGSRQSQGDTMRITWDEIRQQ